MEICPCGNSRPLEACCQPYLTGQSRPETAEQLMRSRYTAYATGAIDYIVETEFEPDREVIENWASTTRFVQLRVLDREAGGPDDESGTVTFEADFEGLAKSSRGPGTHRETSQFRKEDGRWLFLRGKQNPLRQAPKAGRNDPCPCGSGKKFKKCCLPKDSV
ncbi:YchJ family protein [bacterium]|nr:YchJ family protein [bacterium]